MATLYEIDEAIRNLVDEETGEIADFDAFEALAMAREQKIENAALWVKNLVSDADAMKAEAKRLKERAEACERKAERLKEYISFALAGEKFMTPKVAVSFRTSHKIAVTPELESRILNATKRSKLYSFLRVKKTEEIDLKALTEAIKQGAQIDGASITENKNIQIK